MKGRDKEIQSRLDMAENSNGNLDPNFDAEAEDGREALLQTLAVVNDLIFRTVYGILKQMITFVLGDFFIEFKAFSTITFSNTFPRGCDKSRHLVIKRLSSLNCTYS